MADIHLGKTWKEILQNRVRQISSGFSCTCCCRMLPGRGVPELLHLRNIVALDGFACVNCEVSVAVFVSFGAIICIWRHVVAIRPRRRRHRWSKAELLWPVLLLLRLLNACSFLPPLCPPRPLEEGRWKPGRSCTWLQMGNRGQLSRTGFLSQGRY